MNGRGLLILAGAVLALVAAPVSFGASEVKGPLVEATFLDQNGYTCQNCLFGITDNYFCFNAGGKILIGHEKVRTQTRQHTVPSMERGKTLQIRFDDRYIWVPLARGKDLKLTQDYTKKIFLNDEKCQAAVK